MKFAKDMLSEESDGKYSSKKAWGHIIMTAAVVSFVMDGLNFYKVNENLVNSFLITGTTLLGLRVVGKMFGNKNGTESK
jgi:hypothetical protein